MVQPGGAQKRGRTTVHDFSIKADDHEVVKQVLGFSAPVFKTFIEQLTQVQSKEWSEYCLRQKNFDRVIEYTVEELKIKKDFEARRTIYKIY